MDNGGGHNAPLGTMGTRFAPCAITCRAFSPRKYGDNETTRVTPFANLHICTFANFFFYFCGSLKSRNYGTETTDWHTEF